MSDVLNLVVDLDERFALSPERRHALEHAVPGVRVVAGERPDDRTLAWIDERFGGSWSSEAHAARVVVARREGAPVGFAAYDPRGLRFRWLRGLARESGVGVFGPLGVCAEERGKGTGRALLVLALAGLRERGYARALIAAAGERVVGYYAAAVGARVAERFDRSALASPRARVVAMASGNGTNLQALLDASRSNELPVEVAGVVVNDSRARAIERARAAGLTPAVLSWRRREETRAAYDARLEAVVAGMRPDIVLLLGWMHLLGDAFVGAFANLLNLHPAFLPLDPQADAVGVPDGNSIAAFRGARAVQDALAAGSRWAGATVHEVTPATDRGPVIVRRPLRLQPGDDEASVMERLRPIERCLVAAAVMRRLYERP